MNTMQHEFDAVVAHLYKQGKPARNDNSRDTVACFYRQPGTTNSCAVGCRIPDSVYTAAMDEVVGDEGTGVENLIKRFGDVLPPEIKEYEAMFTRLQALHDTCPVNSDGMFNIAYLDYEFRNIAGYHSLTFTVPEAK